MKVSKRCPLFELKNGLLWNMSLVVVVILFCCCGFVGVVLLLAPSLFQDGSCRFENNNKNNETTTTKQKQIDLSSPHPLTNYSEHNWNHLCEVDFEKNTSFSFFFIIFLQLLLLWATRRPPPCVFLLLLLLMLLLLLILLLFSVVHISPYLKSMYKTLQVKHNAFFSIYFKLSFLLWNPTDTILNNNNNSLDNNNDNCFLSFYHLLTHSKYSINNKTQRCFRPPVFIKHCVVVAADVVVIVVFLPFRFIKFISNHSISMMD